MRISTRFTCIAAVVILLPIWPVARAEGQGAPAPAARDSVKWALLQELLLQTRAVDQAMTAMETTVPVQRAANPEIPAVFWDRFLALARKQRAELGDMIAAVYDRHFTTDEVREMLAFYQTPIGRKLLVALPTVMQESMAAGQTWGQQLGLAVATQLDAEGIRIKQ